jgi:putative membrane protein
LANAIEKMKKRKKGLSENAKYRPHIAADGDNTPLEIIRCLSEWVALLEERNTVNG